MSRLSGEQVKIGCGDSTIINNLDAIPDGKVTSIIGPNGWEINFIESVI